MKKLYKNWWVHNCIGHPLMQVLQVFNKDLAGLVHESTLPEVG